MFPPPSPSPDIRRLASLGCCACGEGLCRQQSHGDAIRRPALVLSRLSPRQKHDRKRRSDGNRVTTVFTATYLEPALRKEAGFLFPRFVQSPPIKTRNLHDHLELRHTADDITLLFPTESSDSLPEVYALLTHLSISFLFITNRRPGSPAPGFIFPETRSITGACHHLSPYILIVL